MPVTLGTSGITFSDSTTQTTAVAINRAAAAWLVLNGTSTISILRDYNISSVTDNAAGDYTINFSSALASSSYVVIGGTLSESGSNQPGGVAVYATNRLTGPVTQSTTAVRIITGFGNSAAGYDYARVYVAMFV